MGISPKELRQLEGNLKKRKVVVGGKKKDKKKKETKVIIEDNRDVINEAKEDVVEIKLKVTKLSMNKLYAQYHWSIRSEHKTSYHQLISSQHKYAYGYPCHVEYDYVFEGRALDVSNCSYMTKLIEDCLFPNDGIKIVKSIKMTSSRGPEEHVKIRIIKA